MGGSTKPYVETACRGGVAVVLETEEGVFFLISRVKHRGANSHLCGLVTPNMDVSGHIEYAWEDRNV